MQHVTESPAMLQQPGQPPERSVLVFPAGEAGASEETGGFHS